MARMANEIDILKQFSHPNLIAFRTEYKAQDAFAMEMGDYALSDRIEQLFEQFELEADGNEEIRFEPDYLIRLTKGKLNLRPHKECLLLLSWHKTNCRCCKWPRLSASNC